MKPLIIALAITGAIVVLITVITVPVVLLLPSDLSNDASSTTSNDASSSESTTLATPSPTPATGNYGDPRYAIMDHGTYGEHQQRKRHTTDLRTRVTLYGGVL